MFPRLIRTVLTAALLALPASGWAQLPITNDLSDGFGNTGSGTGALLSNTFGDANTAIGSGSMFRNTTGFFNTALGFGSLTANLSGPYNVALGLNTLLRNDTGSFNTATGTRALLENTSGFENTATGASSLELNEEGLQNTAMGAWALHDNTGNSNTAVGYSAALRNSTGFGNTALGAWAGIFTNTGNYNTAAGTLALADNRVGSRNTALGYQGLEHSIGNRNTGLGYQTLRNTIGIRNTAIGWGAGAALKNGSNNLYLGNAGTATESFTLRLGEAQTRTFIAGVFGKPVSGSQVMISSTGQLGVLASSARYKQDIQPMGDQPRLQQLRPVTFHYTAEPTGPPVYGLIAEEVEKIYPELVVKNANGETESVQYHQLIPILLGEVQRQARELAELKEQVTEAHSAALPPEDRLSKP